MAKEKRELWERQWQQRRGEEFQWYLAEAPQQLVSLLDRPDRPTGAALDLGCGNGVATAHLARYFDPAVGLDIAHAATRQAKDLAAERGVPGRFVVAEAPVLPFRERSFSLVFDRGCLQAIPRESWATYFREVERLLTPGGVLQLFVSKPDRRMPKLLSRRGLRARLRKLTGGKTTGGPSSLSPATIRELVPSSMEEQALERFDFQTGAGTTRQFVYALFRKST
jgi:SAM-dependent methyltransferase